MENRQAGRAFRHSWRPDRFNEDPVFLEFIGELQCFCAVTDHDWDYLGWPGVIFQAVFAQMLFKKSNFVVQILTQFQVRSLQGAGQPGKHQ